MEAKKCSICKKSKLYSDFYTERRNKSGLTAQCKECHNKAVHSWQLKNIKKVRIYKNNYKIKNLDKVIEYNKIWAKNNPDKIIETQKRYYIKNCESRKQKHREWVSNNLQKVRKYTRDWKKNNPERHALNENRRNARKLLIGGSFTLKDWREIKKRQDFTCNKCLRKEPEIKLTIDHIIPISKWFSWSLENNPNYSGNDIQNIQALCRVCNSSKNNIIVQS